MRPVAIVMPTAGVLDAYQAGEQATLTAGIETELIIVPDDVQRGFTRTVNLGFAQVSDGYDVLLLNDDVGKFYVPWLRELSEALYSQDDIGIIGPSGDCRTAPMMQWEPGMTGIEAVEHYPFWCVLIRREVIDQIGWLEERLIHYASDYEYCDRAIDAGWQVCWCKDVVIEHQVNGSGRRNQWAAHDLTLYNLWWTKRQARRGE